MQTVLVAAVAAVVGLGASTASASLLVDFTDRHVWSTGTSSTTYAGLGGLDVSVSASGGSINFNQNFDGPAGASYCSVLACKSDGLGVTDDEISKGQSATVTFGKPVTITGLHFLDLFVSKTGRDREVATVQTNNGDVVTIAAEAIFQTNGGYRFADVNGNAAFANITSLKFFPGYGNDGVGVADFALAGLNVVPLPAGVVLLLSALGGLGVLRRQAAARPA